VSVETAILLAVGVSVAASGWGLLTLLREDRAARARIEERRLTLEERRLTLEEQRVAPPVDAEEVPVDLQLRINAETETWARESMQSLVRELYMKHRNWDSVRAEMGRLDAQTMLAPPGWSQTGVA
jgi:hypothetical protein